MALSLNSKFFNNFLRVKWLPTVVCGQRDLSNSGKFQLKPYKFHRLDESPKLETVLTRDEGLLMYREMVTIRRMEAAANSLYKEKNIRGFCHLYTGQEAVGVGIEHGIRKTDAVITGYRCHGTAYLRGLSVESVMSELTGRRTGCARGKGGSMHMYNHNFFGGNGIVGAQVPLGAGIAFAQQYLKNDGVTVALFGDGAQNQGQVFETYNMAKLYKLPVIFACENNHYGMGTPAARASACTDFYTRGDYVPGLWVDGMDVLSVREAVRFLAEKCREGKGPFVLELETYRYVGHSMSDPGTSYRTREEVQEVRQSRDAISHLKENCLNADLAKAEEFDEIDADIKKIVADAVRIAKTEPELELRELFGDIYVKPLVEKIRGLTPFTAHTHLATRKPINVKL